MAIWPWKKRSKTNSGDKRPTNGINDEPHARFDISARPRSPSIHSVSKSKRRNETLKSIRRAASQRKNKIFKPAQAGPSTPTSNLREVQMASPPPPPPPPPTEPTQSPVAQLQTPVQTPPPSQTRFTPATPENLNRRSNSSASSNRPRKRNLLKKAPTFPADYPSPSPDKDYPRLFRSFSKRSQRGPDSRFRPFSRKEQIDRPLSELSMRTQESLHSIMTSQSQNSPFRAFKVRSLDVLSPRPTLRFASNPHAGEKMPDYPSNHERKSSKSGWRKDRQSPIVEESQTFKRNLVYGLADELDSRGIREALERDTRRRERKQKEDEAKAQAKLERRAAKQRADEEQRNTVNAFRKSQGQPIENSQAGPSRLAGAERITIPTAPIPPHEQPSPRSPNSGTHTPMSWLHGPSQENLHLQLPIQPPYSSGASYKSENDTPVVETATAVRLSGYSTASPPPSPTIMRGQLIDHSPTHSRKMSRDQTILDNIPDPEDRPDIPASENAWMTFFRRATAARVQREHEAQQQVLHGRDELGDTHGHDEGSLTNGGSTVPTGSSSMPRTFLQSPTPKSAGSRVPSDQYLPDLPLPRHSQIAIPVPHDYTQEEVQNEIRMAPLSPSRLGHSSSLSRNLSEARRPSKRVSGKAPWSSQGDITDRYASSHFSETSSRQSFGHERIRSMASIDSEGSWLSGRLANSPSARRIPSLRDSAASLKHQYHDIKVHEDRRASTADDQFFSGVQDAESDEDERDILNSYLDDDVSIRGGPAGTLQYTSPPHSPTSDHGDESDTDPSVDQYLWRDGLGRQPFVTRVDSSFVRKREEVGSLEDASSLDEDSFSHVPMTAELIIEDNDGNMIVPDRRRNSPSPTLGKHHQSKLQAANGATAFLSS
ncbi:hypothetical protein EYR41_006592 [Orbilia oligospora]|uniref:Uncharacterized protein n=1 Tax=Orbilia oligospora TaxID=2813651 RepID=A0A7C8PSF8_ORBOL|nr:hypothetical protein TWF751_001843 [Orbilia oligospora]TGJ67460.1 hypothetical protein EYR41_006592 [Orbilia oligospora]